MDTAQLFTIITITLNNLDGLKNTAASIQGQSNQDIEWIVIDGDSNDGTAEWLKSTTAIWTSEPDNGIYDAMNKGLQRAQGQYILFLNAGDALAAQDTLADLAEAIYTCSLTPDFIYGDALEAITPDECVYKPARPYAKMALGMFTHHQAMLYRREALADMRYNEQYKIAADYDLTIRFLAKTLCHPRGSAKQSLDSGDPEKTTSKAGRHMDPVSANALRACQRDDGSAVLYLPAPICIFESGGISQQLVQRGRKEQMQIRKENKIAGPIANAAIYSAQTLAWKMRSALPNLYWGLKSR